MSISFGFKHAGLVTIWSDARWALHIGVSRSYWRWGRSHYDFIDWFALGPLMMVTWCDL